MQSDREAVACRKLEEADPFGYRSPDRFDGGSDQAREGDVSRDTTGCMDNHGQTAADSACYPVGDAQMTEPRACSRQVLPDGQNGRIYRVQMV